MATEPFQIRLVGGTNATEGRVEITRNGTWGTICDDSWNIQDANVVCRQLGYDRASEAFSNAYFGAGTGPIYLDDVTCFGSETSLDQCFSRPWAEHNCQHYEDAGVRCYGEEGGWEAQGEEEGERLGLGAMPGGWGWGSQGYGLEVVRSNYHACMM